MTPIVFSDLDDTLFQTARKMAEPPQDRLLASHALNGSHSYMTPAQKTMLDWLTRTTRLIPVTARSTEALSRCTIAFRDYRICSNGAVILTPDAKVDPDWASRTQKISASARAELNRLHDHVAVRNADGALRHWIVEEQGLPIYFCVKSNGAETELDRIEGKLTALAGAGFTRHRNGNNLSFTPRDISKRAAVEHMIARIGTDPAVPIWGMGDSLTDLPFMNACQMVVVPTGTQLHQTMTEV